MAGPRKVVESRLCNVILHHYCPDRHAFVIVLLVEVAISIQSTIRYPHSRGAFMWSSLWMSSAASEI
jgi:hypothetical protein